MKSQENPVYTVQVLGESTQYDLTPAVTHIQMTDQENQLAQVATITVSNVTVGGTTLAKMLKPRQRIFIYANDGSTKDEVFRGVIWNPYYRGSLDSEEITLKCYDNLIYFQESEDSLYFSAGKSTKDLLTTICGNWGVQLDYSYQTITHSKLVLRGKLSDIFISDILDKVKDQTGKRYVLLSIKDTLTVRQIGQNATVYKIGAGNNAMLTRVDQTMDGMVTKVVILGKADKDERLPVQATVTGDTAQYGTLQKLYDRDENTSLADAKTEANNILKEKGAPSWSYEVQAHDIPWIRKGDTVSIETAELTENLIVASIDRSISNRAKTMTLTLKDSKDATIKAQKSSTTKTSSNSTSNGGSGGGGSKYWWDDLL